MSLWTVRFIGIFFMGLLGLLGVATYQNMPKTYHEIYWMDLIDPSASQPQHLFSNMNLDEISDNDPIAQEMLKEILLEWSNAPINELINHTSVTISGFVVPLEWEKDQSISEFLLVPYFGACIHSPPPPANQIIYVKLDNPIKGIRSMEEIIVSGTMIIQRNDAATLGVSGYTMQVDEIKRY